MIDWEQINYDISKIHQPSINAHMQHKLKQMFKQVEVAYRIFKPAKRQNFLNQYYVMFKLLQMLNQHELLHHVRLLNSRSRVREHDKLWRLKCDDLGWEFKKQYKIFNFKHLNSGRKISRHEKNWFHF